MDKVALLILELQIFANLQRSLVSYHYKYDTFCVSPSCFLYVFSLFEKKRHEKKSSKCEFSFLFMITILIPFKNSSTMRLTMGAIKTKYYTFVNCVCVFSFGLFYIEPCLLSHSTQLRSAQCIVTISFYNLMLVKYTMQ